MLLYRLPSPSTQVFDRFLSTAIRRQPPELVFQDFVVVLDASGDTLGETSPPFRRPTVRFYGSSVAISCQKVRRLPSTSWASPTYVCNLYNDAATVN